MTTRSNTSTGLFPALKAPNLTDIGRYVRGEYIRSLYHTAPKQVVGCTLRAINSVDDSGGGDLTYCAYKERLQYHIRNDSLAGILGASHFAWLLDNWMDIQGDLSGSDEDDGFGPLVKLCRKRRIDFPGTEGRDMNGSVYCLSFRIGDNGDPESQWVSVGDLSAPVAVVFATKVTKGERRAQKKMNDMEPRYLRLVE